MIEQRVEHITEPQAATGATYREKVLARAGNLDDARALARTMPRPLSVREDDDGSWIVVQLLPARWSPDQAKAS